MQHFPLTLKINFISYCLQGFVPVLAVLCGERLQVKQWLLLGAGFQLRNLQSDSVQFLFGLSFVLKKKEIWEVITPKNNEHIFALWKQQEGCVGALDFHVWSGCLAFILTVVCKDISFITYNHTTYKPDTLLPVYSKFVLHNL